MYRPTLEELKKLQSKGNLAPVYREINADMETPVSAYLKVARGNYSFLLESVEGGERLARYSFIGTEPAKVIKTGVSGSDKIDPLKLIEKEFKQYQPIQLEGLPRFNGGMVGYLSYEVARYYENLPSPERDPLGLPESILMLADTLLIFDHLTHKIKVVTHIRLDGDMENDYKEAARKIDELVKRLKRTATGDILMPASNGGVLSSANVTQEEYEEMVRKMKHHIFEGDIFQGLPSVRVARQTLSVRCPRGACGRSSPTVHRVVPRRSRSPLALR